jgi:hypothetical protein
MLASLFKISLFGLLFLATLQAAELTPEQEKRVATLLDSMSALGKDPKVVEAVKAQNAKLPDVLVGMTNDKWKPLAADAPEVKACSHHELSRYLRGTTHHTVIELFISDAAGRKVTFFSKTTSFIHKGKPKHDKPMAGQKWIGDLEIDQSTQQLQVQGSFPVLENGKPIGSMVLGFWVPKL